MSQATPTEVPISLAATVVVLRSGASGPEVLLVQRASGLAFHGGAWVFPGGRVDPADATAAGAALDADRTARHAAVREATEETGLRLDPAALVPLSHWTTPRGRPRRFATWFFATRLDVPCAIVVDGAEIEAHRWLSAVDAIALHARGELELPPPTFVTLAGLVKFASAEAYLAALRAARPPIYAPRLQRTPLGEVALYAGDVAYDGGPLEQSGPRHRLHMPASGWRYERSPAWE